jgi:hypothetical protein
MRINLRLRAIAFFTLAAFLLTQCAYGDALRPSASKQTGLAGALETDVQARQVGPGAGGSLGGENGFIRKPTDRKGAAEKEFESELEIIRKNDLASHYNAILLDELNEFLSLMKKKRDRALTEKRKKELNITTQSNPFILVLLLCLKFEKLYPPFVINTSSFILKIISLNYGWRSDNLVHRRFYDSEDSFESTHRWICRFHCEPSLPEHRKFLSLHL